MATREFVLAAIGCTGHITELFLKEFSKQNIKLRILARKPELLSERYPNVEIIKGSMLNAADVQKVLKGADAVFVVTPMGVRDNKSSEINAAKNVIEGAKAAVLKHFIYVSVLGADKPKGLSVFDAKHDIENLLSRSGLGWTAIRCGSYMEDVFDPRLSAIKKGTFVFPVRKTCRFTYTPQTDIPRFVVQELLKPERILNRGFNFVSPGTYRILDIENQLAQIRGKQVKATGKFPLLYILRMLMPYFNTRNHRFSTIVPLLSYFDKHGYTDAGETVSDLFPSFKITSLEEHLKAILT